MSEWFPQIVKIEKVETHPDADALDIATVLGDYPVICKRNEYQVGDLAGYIPLDTIVPSNERFHFLSPVHRETYEENGETKTRVLGAKYAVGEIPEKFRIIKAKKIRGIYSMGMLVPPASHLDLGDSLVEDYELKKWEEEEEDNLPSNGKKKNVGANAEKSPQGWKIPYYDIEGVRKYLSCLIEGEPVIFSEKIHGQNFAACFDGDKLWVKSRNFYKRLNEEDEWWDAALRLGLQEKLQNYPMLILFGELYGRVKGYRYDTQIDNGKLMTKVRFFDILDAKTQRYYDYQDRIDLLDRLGLERVPELYRGAWQGKEHAYAFAEGQSTLNPSHLREGMVINTEKERFERKLQSRLQLKLVGEGYSLKK